MVCRLAYHALAVLDTSDLPSQHQEKTVSVGALIGRAAKFGCCRAHVLGEAVMPEDIDEESGEVTVAGTVPNAVIAVGVRFAVAPTAGVAALRRAHAGRDASITGIGRAYLRAGFAAQTLTAAGRLARSGP